MTCTRDIDKLTKRICISKNCAVSCMFIYVSMCHPFVRASHITQCIEASKTPLMNTNVLKI